jgi:hypothetical protein
MPRVRTVVSHGDLVRRNDNFDYSMRSERLKPMASFAVDALLNVGFRDLAKWALDDAGTSIKYVIDIEERAHRIAVSFQTLFRHGDVVKAVIQDPHHILLLPRQQ